MESDRMKNEGSQEKLQKARAPGCVWLVGWLRTKAGEPGKRPDGNIHVATVLMLFPWLSKCATYLARAL